MPITGNVKCFDEAKPRFRSSNGFVLEFAASHYNHPFSPLFRPSGLLMHLLIERICRKFADLLIHRPRSVLAILVVTALFSAAALPWLRFEFTPAAIYRGHDELVNFAEEFKQTFGYDEVVALVLLQATGEHDV